MKENRFWIMCWLDLHLADRRANRDGSFTIYCLWCERELERTAGKS